MLHSAHCLALWIVQCDNWRILQLWIIVSAISIPLRLLWRKTLHTSRTFVWGPRSRVQDGCHVVGRATAQTPANSVVFSINIFTVSVNCWLNYILYFIDCVLEEFSAAHRRLLTRKCPRYVVSFHPASPVDQWYCTRFTRHQHVFHLLILEIRLLLFSDYLTIIRSPSCGSLCLHGVVIQPFLLRFLSASRAVERTQWCWIVCDLEQVIFT